MKKIGSVLAVLAILIFGFMAINSQKRDNITNLSENYTSWTYEGTEEAEEASTVVFAGEPAFDSLKNPVDTSKVENTNESVKKSDDLIQDQDRVLLRVEDKDVKEVNETITEFVDSETVIVITEPMTEIMSLTLIRSVHQQLNECLSNVANNTT